MTKSIKHATPNDPAAEVGRHVYDASGPWDTALNDHEGQAVAHEPDGQELAHRIPVEVDADTGQMYGSATAARSREIWGNALDHAADPEGRAHLENLMGVGKGQEPVHQADPGH
jgi:hypothetical protein